MATTYNTAAQTWVNGETQFDADAGNDITTLIAHKIDDDGTVAMAADLDMDGNGITNLSDSTFVTGARCDLLHSDDSNSVALCGGTAKDNANGAFIWAFGESHVSTPGRLDLAAGDSGAVRLVQGGTLVMSVTAGAVAVTGGLGINAAPTANSPLRISGIPTSSAGLVAGEIWSNGGVLTIVS